MGTTRAAIVDSAVPARGNPVIELDSKSRGRPPRQITNVLLLITVSRRDLAYERVPSARHGLCCFPSARESFFVEDELESPLLAGERRRPVLSLARRVLPLAWLAVREAPECEQEDAANCAATQHDLRMTSSSVGRLHRHSGVTNGSNLTQNALFPEKADRRRLRLPAVRRDTRVIGHEDLEAFSRRLAG